MECVVAVALMIRSTCCSSAKVLALVVHVVQKYKY
jgi:hypothetical protein